LKSHFTASAAGFQKEFGYKKEPSVAAEFRGRTGVNEWKTADFMGEERIVNNLRIRVNMLS
jgi:hypothetical protein